MILSCLRQLAIFHHAFDSQDQSQLHTYSFQATLSIPLQVSLPSRRSTLALENVAWHSLHDVGDWCGDSLLLCCEGEGVVVAEEYGGALLRQASCSRTNGNGGSRNRALQQ